MGDTRNNAGYIGTMDDKWKPDPLCAEFRTGGSTRSMLRGTPPVLVQSIFHEAGCGPPRLWAAVVGGGGSSAWAASR